MAKLTIAECEKIAGRGRPWTFRLEYRGTTDSGNPSHKFWYATGRGLHESVEIGWGAVGAKPQHQLIDWPELRARVREKLTKGYDYADTNFIRMTDANLAVVTAPKTLADILVPTTPSPVTKTVSQTLLSLGEPYSLIRTLRIRRDGMKLVGYIALDEQGDEVLEFDATTGREFATAHDLEIEFN